MLLVNQPQDKYESQFRDALAGNSGIALFNIHVAVRSKSGSMQRREIDALLITSRGLATVEVKSTSATGRLVTPMNGKWTVGGNASAFSVDRPGSQAEYQAKVTAGVLKDAGIEAGFITVWVAIVGSGVMLDREVHDAWGVNVALVSPRIYSQMLAGMRARITAQRAIQILEALGVTSGLSLAEILNEGFESKAAPPPRTSSGPRHSVSPTAVAGARVASDANATKRALIPLPPFSVVPAQRERTRRFVPVLAAAAFIGASLWSAAKVGSTRDESDRFPPLLNSLKAPANIVPRTDGQAHRSSLNQALVPTRRSEARQSPTLRELMELADKAASTGRLTSPAGGNTLDYLMRARTMFPGERDVDQAIQRLVHVCLDAAGAASLNADDPADLRRADDAIEQALLVLRRTGMRADADSSDAAQRIAERFLAGAEFLLRAPSFSRLQQADALTNRIVRLDKAIGLGDRSVVDRALEQQRQFLRVDVPVSGWSSPEVQTPGAFKLWYQDRQIMARSETGREYAPGDNMRTHTVRFRSTDGQPKVVYLRQGL